MGLRFGAVKMHHCPSLSLPHEYSGLIHGGSVETVGVLRHDMPGIGCITRVAKNPDDRIYD